MNDTTRELWDEYPEHKWSDELKNAVSKERRDWLQLVRRPFKWLVRIGAGKYEREKGKAWGKEHYKDWEHEELVWRLRFLQEICRANQVEKILLVRWVMPMGMAMALVVGLLLGS